jgi:hypothetical protein
MIITAQATGGILTDVVDWCFGWKAAKENLKEIRGNTLYRSVFGGEQGQAFPPKPEHLQLLKAVMGQPGLFFILLFLFSFLKKKRLFIFST